MDLKYYILCISIFLGFLKSTYKWGLSVVLFNFALNFSTLITERKAMCERAFSLVFDNNEAFFGKDYFSYYYDMQAILYSLKQLDLGEEKEVCLSLERDRGDYNGYDKFGKFAKIEVLLKNVRDAFQLTLGDLSAFLTNDTSGQNHSLRQFIEIATSQVPLFMP